jgi:hypothetical protein
MLRTGIPSRKSQSSSKNAKINPAGTMNEQLKNGIRMA